MIHTPVLVEEVLDLFQPKQNDTLLDATLGTGGHAAAYLSAATGTKVVGLDADPLAIKRARENLKRFTDGVTYVNANFANLQDSLTGGGILPPKFSHIIFDLGVGSHQLSDARRGFSFQEKGPLDMRYGEQRDLPASSIKPVNDLTSRLGHCPNVVELIMGLRKEQLAEVIRSYGQERFAGRIARSIKSASPFPHTAAGLASLIAMAVPSNYERGRIHPATRTFQALRLAVNRELEALTAALPQAASLLKPRGVLAVISFHSLEDRVVKHFMRGERRLEVMTPKPGRASGEEIAGNPRARSAKLRAALKKTPGPDKTSP